MQRQVRSLEQCVPLVGLRFELEVTEAGVVGQMARYDGQSMERYAGQLKGNQFADPLQRCDLALQWEVLTQLIQRHLGFDGQHQGDRFVSGQFMQRADPDPVGLRL